MKSIFDSFFAAFSLYSAIPVPRTEWTSRSVRYSLCFFPLVGVVSGALLLGWHYLCVSLGVSSLLFAIVSVLLPILVTGGIHMDGYIDTSDANASHAPPERRLEILKDPHVGAFGVLGCICVLLLQAGLWHELYDKALICLLPIVGNIVSRAMCALSIATFPSARSSGLSHMFSESAQKSAAVTSCVIYLLLGAVACVLVSPLWGSAAILVSIVYFFIHRAFCAVRFGGNTGDLAGFFLVNVEIIFLVCACIGSVLA